MNTLQDRIQRAVREEVCIAPYDSNWPDLFRREAEHLRSCLPVGLIRRIEHFGSTAVPGLAAKPVVDMLVQVASLRAARIEIAPILEAQNYYYFWRPSFGDDVPPWYAFFIKRDRQGMRTHHIHMVTRGPVFKAHWERLRFRDTLIAHPQVAPAPTKTSKSRWRPITRTTGLPTLAGRRHLLSASLLLAKAS